MAIELQSMAPGGVWLQPHSAEVPPAYVVHPSHIQRLTLEGWRPVNDPRAEVLAQQAAQKTAEEKERKEREDAQAKKISDLEALVQKLLAAQQAAPKVEESAVSEENKKQTTTRRKAE